MEKIKVRITALKAIHRRFAVMFMGAKVAVAFSHDSGARVGYDSRLISGEIGSSGSRANWTCDVHEGATFEIEIGSRVFTQNKNQVKNWEMVVIPEFSMTKERAAALEKMKNNMEK